MKFTLMSLLLLALVPAAVAQVTFQWDPHEEAATITGFHLYQTKNPGSYGAIAVQTFMPGTLTSGQTPKPGLGKWCFVLTAYVQDPGGPIDSGYSNEVCEVFKPKAPTNFVTKAIVAMGNAIKNLFAGKKGLRIVDKG